MPIYERLHNGKKQWCYRCYYTDFNGDRVQKHSKWFNTRKEAVAAENTDEEKEEMSDEFADKYEQNPEDLLRPVLMIAFVAGALMMRRHLFLSTALPSFLPAVTPTRQPLPRLLTA